MSNNRFRKDYAKSREIEIAFQEALASFNCFLIEDSSTKGLFKDWDVSTTSTTNNAVSTYEIKYQKQHDDNVIFIELSKVENGYQVEAGLSSTKSDFYTLKIENDPNFYIIPTDKIKELVATKQYKKTFLDRNNYLLAIFNQQDLLKYATIL